MVILVGASASGKTEVARLLERRYGIKKATTTTSRLPRVGEKDGVDYFFVSGEAFERLIADNRLIEHAVYNGNYYGCGKDQAAENRSVVLDPNGLVHFLSLGDKGIVTFYLTAEEATRAARMRGRGDRKEDIEKRLQNDRVEFAPGKIHSTDFTIKTDGRSIEDITDEVYGLYMEELKKRGLK